MLVRRALSALLLLSACATQRSQTTWEDDAREGIGISATPREASPAQVERRAATTIGARPDGPPAATEAREADLELALMRFGAKRRQIAAQNPPTEKNVWPRPLEAAFLDVVEGFERGLASMGGRAPRRVLIQARVTIEAEMENAQARYGEPSQDLTARIGHLFGSIALEMRRSRPTREEHVRDEGAPALVWPVAPVIVTSQFGYRRDPILGRQTVRFHAGVDLGGELGVMVHSAADGRVVSAGWLGGHGRAVIVQHPGGYQTVYAHLRQILVSAGAEVDAGSPLGLMGSSGRSTGPHLHFEVRRGGVPLDPLDALGPSYAVSDARN